MKLAWVMKDGGVYYVDQDASFGFRTQAEIVRCSHWDRPQFYFLMKTKYIPHPVRFANVEDAKHSAETVVALNYSPDTTRKTFTPRFT